MTTQEQERRRKVLHLLGAVCPKCKRNDPREPHACPFACEIDGDFRDDHCQCCASCEDECASDI